MSIWGFLNLLLSLVIIHTQLHQIHLFQNLEIHVDDLFAEKSTLKQTYKISFFHDGLEIFKDFSQLKWIPLCVVLWKLKRIIRGATVHKLLILLKPIQQYYIFANLILSIVSFHLVRELDKLLGEHVVQKLFEGLVRFIITLF